MSATWQQILALDAKYNTIRVPNNPQFRTQYIRRRSQLLPEYSKGTKDTNIRKQYLKIRGQILSCRYGYVADQSSIRSYSLSGRSNSRITLETTDSGEFLEVRRSSDKNTTHESGLVPTHSARASRALVGGTTISENYAFAGVYFIFDQHSAAVTSVRFANDELSRLACCSQDGSLSICQVIPPPAQVIFLLQGHTLGVTAFAWSLSNDLIVSCSLDKTIRLWATSSGVCVRVVEDKTCSPLYSCVFQPLNNNMVVTGNQRGLVHVLNISTGIYAKGGSAKMAGKVLALTFDSSGHLLWAGDDKGMILSFLFELPTGRLTRGHRMLLSESRPITCLSARNWVSREARDPSLLVNCACNALTLFRIVDSNGSLQFRKKFHIRHQSLSIKSSFCPMMSFRQGACVVTGSEDCCVYFYDIESERKKCVNKLQGHSSPVLDVCFNYDESLLASSDELGTVIVWKRETNKNKN